MNFPLHPSERFPELPRTKADARSQGLRLYYPALRCRRGHYAPRNVVSLRCIDCLAQDRQARQARDGRIKAQAVKQVQAKVSRLVAQQMKQRIEEVEREAKEATKRAVKEAREDERKKARAAATREANKLMRQQEAASALAAAPRCSGPAVVALADCAPWE